MSDRVPQDSKSLLLERVELAFPELLPGFRVHERKLHFDGNPVADLLAWGGGRALLISLVEEDDNSAVLRALDGLALARDHADVIVSCIPGSSEEHLRPRVLLVADSFPARLVDRLHPLLGESLSLVRRHELCSARGSLTRLEPFESFALPVAANQGTELPEWATREPMRDFLARVAPDRLALTLEILDRIQRIDPSLEPTEQEGDLAWVLCDETLCRMCWVEGHLELYLSDSSVPHAIRDEQAIDFVLDWVMAGYLEILRAERLREESDSVESMERDLRAMSEAVGETASEEEEEEPGSESVPAEGAERLPQIELRPVLRGPLLSAEEIQAFHE